jgi:hypothetical protein
MAPRVITRFVLGGLLLAWSSGTSAQAISQDSSPGQSSIPAAQQGPLKLQRVRSGVVFAPDGRIADVDGVTGTFVGGYAGWLADDRFLVGGAAYWLASPTDERDISYFGGIVGWQVPVGDAFRFGARGLVGGGWATLLDTYSYWVSDHPWGPRPTPVNGSHRPGPVEGWAYFSDDFFVFEPQVDLSIRFGHSMSLTTGVSYRVVAGAGEFDDRLRGVAGSIAFQFGVF